MKDNPIQVQAVQLAITNLQYDFAVQIMGPIAMPAETYSISVLDVIVSTVPVHQYNQVISEILYRKILTRYNQLIENQPLLDMMEDPDKFAPATGVELEFVSFLVEWTGVEPVTPGSSDQRSTN
jgi:hypothetical protein